MTRALVALGSNLGDRASTIEKALEAICRLPGTCVVARSALVETEPGGGPPQGPFLNAAARLRYDGEPHALLEDLLRVERSLGRVRIERWGPRTIDLDILWIDGRTVDDARLVVPHPRLMERPFALEPLLEIAPEAEAQLRKSAPR